MTTTATKTLTESDNDVRMKSLEVQQLLLGKLETALGDKTYAPSALESLANAYAIVRSGTPVSLGG